MARRLCLLLVCNIFLLECIVSSTSGPGVPKGGGLPFAHSNRTVTVSKNGTGDFITIGDAVKSAPKMASEYFQIIIEEGVYEEYLLISEEMPYLIFAGAGINRTIITGDHSMRGGWTTFNSATLVVEGMHFITLDITIENTAGPENGQAVAVRADAKFIVFYRCSFLGYQDTLYVHYGIQFYRECDIYGTVDFIFGDATAVFQNCNIYVREPMPGQVNTITAQGRHETTRVTGISIHNCTVKAAPDLKNSTKTYLGRPWRQYSTTVFMQSFLDGLIKPSGWLEWNRSFESTLYYGEYKNYGPGADTSKRVNWPGYHRMELQDATNFTVDHFIDGGAWLPNTSIPYTPNLNVTTRAEDDT